MCHLYDTPQTIQACLQRIRQLPHVLQGICKRSIRQKQSRPVPAHDHKGIEEHPGNSYKGRSQYTVRKLNC